MFDSTQQRHRWLLAFSSVAATALSLLALASPAAASDPIQVPVAQVAATVEQVETQVSAVTSPVAEVEIPEPQSVTGAAASATKASPPAASTSGAHAPEPSGAADRASTLHADGGAVGEAVDAVTPSASLDEGQVGGNRKSSRGDASQIASAAAKDTTIASAVRDTVDRVRTRALQPAGKIVRQVPLAERLPEIVAAPISRLTEPLLGALTSLLDSVSGPAAPVVGLVSPSGSGSDVPPSNRLAVTDNPIPANLLGDRGLPEVGGPMPELTPIAGFPSVGQERAKLGSAAARRGHRSSAAWTAVATGSSGSDNAGIRTETPPLDTPLPPPLDVPGAATPGPGGSFFIPLAALLALLALAAPATLRRLREAPAWPAPTPFVCALERPG